jgi:hypothetical protein
VGPALSASRQALERLKPYVPRIAIDWLRDTPGLAHKQLEGSLAFADISGFTTLTERLSRKGKVGAEEMRDILNACFTELLSVAYSYGAGVVRRRGEGPTRRVCDHARCGA